MLSSILNEYFIKAASNDYFLYQLIIIHKMSVNSKK